VYAKYRSRLAAGAVRHRGAGRRFRQVARGRQPARFIRSMSRCASRRAIALSRFDARSRV
jgi:hypothetical protein